MRKRGGIRHPAHREAISLDGCGNGSDLSELLHIQFEKERKICSFFCGKIIFTFWALTFTKVRILVRNR